MSKSHEIIRLEDEITMLMSEWTKFRREMRQILHENGIRTNPGWTEKNIVDAMRELIGNIKNSKV